MSILCSPLRGTAPASLHGVCSTGLTLQAMEKAAGYLLRAGPHSVTSFLPSYIHPRGPAGFPAPSTHPAGVWVRCLREAEEQN